MLLRKSVLDKVGLLDDTFFMYGEDIDLSYRMNLGGYNNYYFPEAIIHYKGESTKKDVRYVKIFYQAMIIFFRKHYPNYSRLYGLFVYFAIYIRAGFAALGKLIPKKKKHKTSDRNHVVLSTDELTYEEIIHQISLKEKVDGKKIIYHVYHPETKILIAPNEILTNKEKGDYGLP